MVLTKYRNLSRAEAVCTLNIAYCTRQTGTFSEFKIKLDTMITPQIGHEGHQLKKMHLQASMNIKFHIHIYQMRANTTWYCSIQAKALNGDVCLFFCPSVSVTLHRIPLHCIKKQHLQVWDQLEVYERHLGIKMQTFTDI